MTEPNVSDPEFTNVLATLRDYYDGLYHIDIDKLRRAFSPSARYATASGGELLELALDDYLERVRRRPAPRDDGTPYGYTVHSVRFAGPVTALAEVSCSLFGHDYSDFLALLRIDGRWRIQSKVFHGEPHAAAAKGAN